MATDRRTARDFAEAVRWLAEDVSPKAGRVGLVADNLNTHKLASLYAAFPPGQARRVAERIEVHHPPKHGSWLSVAEIGPAVLARQCLDRRIESAGRDRVAVHDRRRPDHAPPTLPRDRVVAIDYVPAGTYGVKVSADGGTLCGDFNGHAGDKARPGGMRPDGFGPGRLRGPPHPEAGAAATTAAPVARTRVEPPPPARHNARPT